MAIAPVDPELQLVASVDEVRRAVAAFASQAPLHPDLARDLIVYAHLWVHDPEARKFGPSKFVGVRDMNYERYGHARTVNALDGQFDGHGARRRIERLVGSSFDAREDLLRGLREWLETLLPDTRGSVLKGVDTSKWRFISLPSAPKAGPWSDQEIADTVRDYMAMLHQEVEAYPYDKADHRKTLLQQLPGRTTPAVEFKHCNISAVLEDIGLPYIAGYKPRSNYQGALADAVEGYLATDPELLATLEASAASVLARDALVDLGRDEVLEEPRAAPEVGDGIPRPPRPSKIDWAARDAKNRELGAAGEHFVANMEQRRLAATGRGDLAGRVEIVSQSQGDGLGYDVLSFEDDGSEKFIEVKATNGDKTRPFYLSANEVWASERLGGQYWLYRVFRRGGRRKIFVVPGPLTTALQLEAVVYRARMRAAPQ